jgi:hypothetical protein
LRRSPSTAVSSDRISPRPWLPGIRDLDVMAVERSGELIIRREAEKGGDHAHPVSPLIHSGSIDEKDPQAS